MHKVWKNVRFSQNEILFLIITAIIGGVLLAFRKWGESTLDFNAGIENTIISAIAILIALIVNFGVQKIYAGRKGYETKYHPNYYGLGVGLMLGVITNGFIALIMPGWVTFKSKDIQRIGKWRYRPYFREYGYTVNWGIAANLLVATLASGFSNPIFHAIFFANLLIAIFTLIPTPYNGGFHIFFTSFYQFAFMLCFTLLYAALLTANAYFHLFGPLVSLVLAFFMGVLGLYFVFYKGG